MARLIDGLLIATIGGCIVVGAYQTGKLSERKSWRVALASQNASVKSVMDRLGDEAEQLDSALLAEIANDQKKLFELEKKVQSPPADSRPACAPVPAVCLRRATGGTQANGGATGSSGAAGTTVATQVQR